MTVADRFRDVAQIDPAATAIYFRDRTYSWAELTRVADAVSKVLTQAHLKPSASIGWIARNHPAVVGAALGVLRDGYCLSPVNPHQPEAKLAEEVVQLRFAVIIGCAADWSDTLKAAVRKIGAIGLVTDIDGPEPIVSPLGLERLRTDDYRTMEPNAVLERMSSGTTGEPKRMLVGTDLFARSMSLAGRGRGDRQKLETLTLSRSPALQVSPFAHSAGIFGIVMSLYYGRPTVLFEKFDAAQWVETIARFRPKFASLVPSMMAMVMKYDPPKEKLASLTCVRSGTAPLDVALKRAFEERFGIPVLGEYGASEFMGGVAGWSLDEYKRLRDLKRDAVGKPLADVEARIADPQSGAILPTGATGILQLRSPRWGKDWIATTDLASLDVDGYLYIHGRADEAIIRGGFKILPEKVAEVLRLFPGVRDACVLGVKDERLGQVPLAILECEGEPPSGGDLSAFVRTHLPAYQVPVAYEFVEALPRTPSLKVMRPALRERFKDRYSF
jgi:long-chain acyl-CoA synthetase